MNHPRLTSSRRDANKHLRGLLDALSARPRVDQAEDRRLAGQALALARQLGDPLLVAECQLAGGRHLTTFMEPEATWTAVREAARIFRANGLPARESACQVVAARALYDMAKERQAAATAHAALQEPALAAADRVCAYLVLFNAHGRMGRLEEAYAFLNEQALPLARAVGDGHLLAHALQLKGWLFARLANSEQNADLPLPAYRVLAGSGSTPKPLARALALLEEAQACLPAGSGWRGIEIDRHYVLGLARTGDAASAAARHLAEIADAVRTADPPLAASAHFTRALLLQDAGDLAGALEALPPALAIAEANGLSSMTRDLLFMRSIISEAMGNVAGAYEALKLHSRMTLGSGDASAGIRFDWPEHDDPAMPGDEAGLPPHRLRELESAHLRRATRWIDPRVGSEIKVDDVVRACGVSRRTLDAAFQAGKGTTIAGYVKRKQIEHASEQLLHTDRPVREIASAIGYRSPTMFAREFRDRLGLTPTQWRGMSQQAQAGSATPAVAAPAAKPAPRRTR